MPEPSERKLTQKQDAGPPLSNSRQELFAQGVFRGLTHTQAAIEAGYSPTTARVQASQLLTRLNILTRINELHELAATDAVMSVQERKERLSEIARARLADFVQIDGDSFTIDLKSGESAALQEVTVTEWKGGKDERAESRATKVKLHDPVKSIAELNKMGGDYAPEKVDLTEGLTELLGQLRGRVVPEIGRTGQDAGDGEK